MLIKTACDVMPSNVLYTGLDIVMYVFNCLQKIQTKLSKVVDPFCAYSYQY